VAGADPNLPASGRTIAKYFNTAAFVRQTVGTYGTFERNRMRGPKAVKFDLSVSKNFRLTSGTQFQLTAQAFNLLNRTNFNNPNGQLGQRRVRHHHQRSGGASDELSLKLIY